MIAVLLRLALSAASGAAIVLATATFDLWQLAWVAFLPLFAAVRDQPIGRAWLYGWAAGLVANVGGFYWVPQLLLRFGHIPLAGSWSLFLLLALYQGLPWAAFAALLSWLQRRRGWSTVLLAPPLMTAAELLTPMVFDWYLAITQAWVPPAIQIAELTGPLGVTFLIMVSNGLLDDLLRRLRPGASGAKGSWRPQLAGAALLLAALAFGYLRLPQIEASRRRAPKLRIGAVQGNVGIVERLDSATAARHHAMHLAESRKLQAAGAELILWPESAYPYAIERTQRRDFAPNDPRRVSRGLRVPLIFGATSYSRWEPYPYNSAFMLGADGRFAGRYDKNYPLIFGEHIPFYEHIPRFRRWFPAASHLARGTRVTTFPLGPHRIGPMICYEDLLPAFGRRLAALQPQLLVNLTNDAWFGASAEPYQHLALAVFRSVELRLDLVRSVNTGVSAVIEATGRVRAATQVVDPALTPNRPPSTLLHSVALMPPHTTVYARVGDAFGYANLAIVALYCLVALRRSGGRQARRGVKRGRQRTR
ncbi:MAG: apolipoprotein N-acyltransferase [Proteobacteria bacterium]|nr:apolipoprotein N-acyltransferase [Pseudomonadota bacterium]